ncbi:hypothetical protein NK8_19920 [Caballeronia sp. NK8]|nr:hypothetical protein NK8_19920 [Caballeronia sp. NK8]
MADLFRVRENTLENRRAREPDECKRHDPQKTRRPHRDARRRAGVTMRPFHARARHMDPRDDERAVLSGA